MRFVSKNGIPAEDARDIVQEVFASLVRSLPNFELDHSRGRFRTWLWRVVQNAVADWGRRRRRERAAQEGWREARALEGGAEDPGGEWDAAVQRRILGFSMERVREKSDPRTWACFEKHVLQGQRGADVASELGMKAGAVYVNAARVLERVRRLCEEYADEELGHEVPEQG
jgi:RNA polymerase sigma-70 factor (ECF subfamily)